MSADADELTDADLALVYDMENPWDRRGFPQDRFFSDAVAAADSVLDVGCGTGSMLHVARAEGHTGRLTGVDPDPAMLGRARRRTGLGPGLEPGSGPGPEIEWVAGTAAELAYDAEFDLATMASNAFQCLADPDELRDSLTAIRRALRPGGAFVFGTRHLQARAWEQWNPANAGTLTLPDGREIRGWHQVERVEGALVTFTETAARPDGTPLRVSRTTLRFHTPETLNPLLAAAGFTVEAQFGDWDRGPLTDRSREIATIARAR
ncbi:class I SAM-dependent methyltransferase [Catenulispora yoronensis]|uniref:Class I SAM-dependent methyltransferase n=1 Tax=Catenulispora yoronensis TaxID=450799 RepID=A0ABN2V734_9ACTN